MHDVLRFWLDRGVDGFRMDVVHLHRQGPRPARRPARAGGAAPRAAERPARDPRAAARLPRRAGRRTRATDGWSARSTCSTPRSSWSLRRSRRRAAPGVQLPSAVRAVGRRASGAARSQTPRPSTIRSAPGPPGSCPTTTPAAIAPGTAAEARARAAAVLLLTLRGTPFLLRRRGARPARRRGAAGAGGRPRRPRRLPGPDPVGRPDVARLGRRRAVVALALPRPTPSQRGGRAHRPGVRARTSTDGCSTAPSSSEACAGARIELLDGHRTVRSARRRRVDEPARRGRHGRRGAGQLLRRAVDWTPTARARRSARWRWTTHGEHEGRSTAPVAWPRRGGRARSGLTGAQTAGRQPSGWCDGPRGPGARRRRRPGRPRPRPGGGSARRPPRPASPGPGGRPRRLAAAPRGRCGCRAAWCRSAGRAQLADPGGDQGDRRPQVAVRSGASRWRPAGLGRPAPGRRPPRPAGRRPGRLADGGRPCPGTLRSSTGGRGWRWAMPTRARSDSTWRTGWSTSAARRSRHAATDWATRRAGPRSWRISLMRRHASSGSRAPRSRSAAPPRTRRGPTGADRARPGRRRAASCTSSRWATSAGRVVELVLVERPGQPVGEPIALAHAAPRARARSRLASEGIDMPRKPAAIWVSNRRLGMVPQASSSTSRSWSDAWRTATPGPSSTSASGAMSTASGSTSARPSSHAICTRASLGK